MADKDLPAVFAPLAARARRIVFVAPDSPRAEPPEHLRVRVGRPDARDGAVRSGGLARLEAAGGAAPILVAGSLYLAGEVLALRG